jgi:hypothetical protein
MPWGNRYAVDPLYPQPQKKTVQRPRYLSLPDPCGRRSLPTMREYLSHITRCSEPSCKEALSNHIVLCASLGVEFHPPR